MSLSADAYSLFKVSLLEKKITTGQFLTQRELSNLLGVSMGPLRDALKKLENEKLIEVLPQKGIRIAHVDRTFVLEAYEMRRFLEVGAIRQISRSSDRDFLRVIRDETESIRQRAEVNIDSELLSEALKVDERLHSELIAVLNNSLVSDAHKRVTDRVKLIRLNYGFVASRINSALAEHLAIMDACIEGDEAAAVRALEYHLGVSESRALGNEVLSL